MNNKKEKKFIKKALLGLSLLSLLAFTSCGGSKKSDDSGTKNTNESTIESTPVEGQIILSRDDFHNEVSPISKYPEELG